MYKTVYSPAEQLSLPPQTFEERDGPLLGVQIRKFGSLTVVRLQAPTPLPAVGEVEVSLWLQEGETPAQMDARADAAARELHEMRLRLLAQAPSVTNG